VSAAEAAGAPGSYEARVQHALDLAYRFLGFRDRTVAEVLGHLAAKDVDLRTARAAVAVLREQDYLDDVRFAQRFTEDRRNLDDWGAERIERKLDELGIERDVIAEALERPAEDELEAAVALLRRRLTGPPADERAREKALGLLVRRGYGLELAYDAVRAVERDRA
jgi:regulatory protein